jgi:hypothetical protein
MSIPRYLPGVMRPGQRRPTSPGTVHKIGEVYLTWSFSGPDGRVLFTIGPDADGEPVLTWLAIGYHDIYQ